MLRNDAQQTAKSGRSQGIRVFCIERNCVIEEGFCQYVCPKTQECPLWSRDHALFRSMTRPTYYDQRPVRVSPATIQHAPDKSSAKQQSMNCIPNQFLNNPPTTLYQVNDLRRAPWIGHVEGYKWPECECPACCSELLINLMRETHNSYHAKTQTGSSTKASLA